MKQFFKKIVHSKFVVICFLAFLFSGCSKNYSVNEITYNKGAVEKRIIYWADKNNVDHIVTQYRQSMIPVKEKVMFGKPLVQYYKKSKPIKDDGNTLYLQEVDLYKSYTSKGLKPITKSYIYVKNGKIIANKLVYNDGVISDIVVNDDSGHTQKVFDNHRKEQYFYELDIYKDEEVVQRKPINIPITATISQLKRIE